MASSIHLIEGPVGAGKSTFAARLALEIAGVHIPLDEWFVQLFSPDRPSSDFVPWYIERKDRLIDVIWHHTLALHAAGTSAILELGLIRRADRAAFFDRARAADIELSIHLLDAPLETRRERVRRRNAERGATFSMLVPDHVFEMASGLWEPLDEIEVRQYGMRLVSTESGSAAGRCIGSP